MGRGTAGSKGMVGLGRPSFSKTDFRYALEVDYYSGRNCDDYGCDSDGICRCGQITDASVSSIYPSGLASVFLREGSKEGPPADVYAVDRLLRLEKIWDSAGEWEINVCGGYYGEEIESVRFDSVRAAKLDAEIEKLLKLPLGKRVAFLLRAEHGTKIKGLEKLDWKIEEVPLVKIKNAEAVANPHPGYSPRPYGPVPNGVCIADDDGFILLDGRERVSAVKFPAKKATDGKKPGKLKMLVGRPAA